MEQILIDKAEVEYRFKKSIESYDENAHAQKAIVQRLMTLLDAYCPLKSGRILEVGCGTGLLTARLKDKYKDCDLFINDLVEDMCSKAASRCQLSLRDCFVGDMEQVNFEGNYDLIVSASTFQWLEHPAETFTRLAGYLCKGGQMVFSTFGEDNYKELKMITGHGLVYHSLIGTIELLSDCFEIVHTEENHYVMEFDDPVKVLKHVKNTGVNAINRQQSWTRGKLARFAREYTERFRVKGHYPLTYHPRYFICRKKG